MLPVVQSAVVAVVGLPGENAWVLVTDILARTDRIVIKVLIFERADKLLVLNQERHQIVDEPSHRIRSKPHCKEHDHLKKSYPASPLQQIVDELIIRWPLFCCSP